MYASTRRSPDEQQHSLLICQLRFDQAGLAPARLKQEVSQTRHLIPLLQTSPSAIGACTAFKFVTAYRLAKSPKRPSTPEASAASFPPLLLRLLPGGANQFPGGIRTHCGPAPFHGARGRWVRLGLCPADVPVRQAIADPVATTQLWAGTPHRRSTWMRRIRRDRRPLQLPSCETGEVPLHRCRRAVAEFAADTVANYREVVLVEDSPGAQTIKL